jgi:NitT/TauT family transport system permease protein
MPNLVQRLWGEANALLHRTRRIGWTDILVLAAGAGVIAGLTKLGNEAGGPLRPVVEIDLSPWALPKYTFFSLSRGLAAYGISLTFTLIYGYWAAKDRAAERVLVPLLDILQSIPVLGFMPGVVLALVGLFPRTNIGLELAAVVMIFTGQAWNMTFSFYHSLRSIPTDQREAATIYRFNWWQRFKWVELPFSMIGLTWNSMMSMAGGWFFLMVSEAFVLRDKDFRLPGVGSYMSVAVDRGDVPAMIYAIIAMSIMVILLDQVLWRPVVVWAQKFRVEEGGEQEAMSSWVLDLIRHSELIQDARAFFKRTSTAVQNTVKRPEAPRMPRRAPVWMANVSFFIFLALLFALAAGGWALVGLLRQVPGSDWAGIFGDAGRTLVRVLTATAGATLWTLPAGLAIGLSARLSRLLQPVVQVVASFPAPMLFPLVVGVFSGLGIQLQWSSVALMLLGTQWYILFNVIAGAMAVPADLREASRSYRLTRWQRFANLYLPCVFPYLVTGWVTAAGGAWNASIVSEYVTFRGKVLTADGLGARISEAASKGNFPELAASVVVMSGVVVLFNYSVWRRLYHLAQERFSLDK